MSEEYYLPEFHIYNQGADEFVHSLSMDRIRKFMNDIQIKMRGKEHTNNIATHHIGSIQTAVYTFDNFPLNTQTASCVREIWFLLEKSEEREKHAELDMMLLRRKIMMANSKVWTWLESTCRQRCWDVLFCRAKGNCWIDRLTVVVHNFTIQRAESKTFRPEDYLPFTGDPFVLKSVGSNNCMYLESEQEQQLELVIARTISVVSSFMHFTPNMSYRAKGVFVHQLISAVGPEVLLMRSVWDQYN